MNKYQFTLWSTKGFAPVAATVEANSRLDFAEGTAYRNKALIQICTKRGWTIKDLKEKYGYTIYKVRIVPEKE